MNLGHRIGRSTIARILARSGVDPAPQRPERWSTFLAGQWGAISAADFFTVEVVTIRGLCRYHVFFVLDLATRKVQIVGMARNPSGVWVKNAFRRLTDEVDGFLRNSAT